MRNENDFVLCDKCGKKQFMEDGPVSTADQGILCMSCWKDYSKVYKSKPSSKVPKGCVACGGPYPDCKSSCKMFD